MQQLLLVLPGLVVGFGPKDKWVPMVVYDVLQEGCRYNISNNNVGDPAGDIYFNLKDL